MENNWIYFTRLLLVCFFIFSRTVSSQDMMQLRPPSGRWNMLTSSTLQWRPLRSGKAIPHNAVPVDKNFPQAVWCRAEVNGMKIPGEVTGKGKCKVAFTQNKPSYADDYYILISINGSARIKYEDWDAFMVKPANALQSPNRILAVYQDDKSDRLLAAHIGTRQGRSAVTAIGDKVLKVDKSLKVLVEDEPYKYFLRNVQFNSVYEKEKSSYENLNYTVLTNEEYETKEISDMLPYLVKEIQYWGRPKGTITAMDAVVETPKGRLYDIVWGTETQLNSMEFGDIIYELPPRSAVNVTLMALIKEYESPYAGILESEYKDGFSTSRHIQGFHQEKRIDTVIAKYGIPYSVDSERSVSGVEETSKLVYERTTTTTTTSTTTSTTTTSSTTSTSTLPSTTPNENIETSTVNPASSEESYDPFIVEEIGSSVSPSMIHNNQIDWGQPSSESLSKSEPDGHKVSSSSSPKSEPSKNSGSASERLLSGLSTIFTALVFWYFSLGA